MSGYVSGSRLEFMSNRMSECMSDRISVRMSRFMSGRMAEYMSDKMSGYVSGSRLEFMCDRRLKFLSDRVSEFMPDTVTKNVMVAIPWSEIISFVFFVWRNWWANLSTCPYHELDPSLRKPTFNSSWMLGKGCRGVRWQERQQLCTDMRQCKKKMCRCQSYSCWLKINHINQFFVQNHFFVS